MCRKLTVVTSLIALLLNGCVYNPHSHGGRMIAEYRSGEGPVTEQTPYKAQYVLYHWRDAPCDPPPHTWIPANEVYELYVRGLEKRQDIGFDRDGDGKLFAIAAAERIPLEEGRYCWHISRNSEYKGMKWLLHETGDRVVEIVALPVGLAACVIMLPVFIGTMVFFVPMMMLM